MSAPEETKPARPKFSLSLLLQLTVSAIVLGIVIWNVGKLSSILTVKYEQPKPSKVVGLAEGTWRFIVSGDSRNCGDVIMPAIASHSMRYSPVFYWHLGDLRAIYKIDEDIRAEFKEEEDDILSCDVYYHRAWSDFVRNQIAPFGRLPFYIGIGNHEVIPPKSEDQFANRFKDWLTSEALNKQRLLDGEKEPLFPRPYYHWVQGGVDFIYLDNASDSFSKVQLNWFDQTLAKDASENAVLSLVVGMHEALPDSIASDHSMCDDPRKVEGCVSGRHVYDELLKLQKTKAVYVLASHSHFYMERIFQNLAPDRQLPGWIVGTAGAVRYKLPSNAPSTAKTDLYGYLLGTVRPDGTIQFEFQEIKKSDVPDSVWQRFSPSLVPWCFAHNSANVDPDTEAGSQRCTPPTKPSAVSR
jgi:hypothetical protein